MRPARVVGWMTTATIAGIGTACNPAVAPPGGSVAVQTPATVTNASPAQSTVSPPTRTAEPKLVTPPSAVPSDTLPVQPAPTPVAIAPVVPKDTDRTRQLEQQVADLKAQLDAMKKAGTMPEAPQPAKVDPNPKVEHPTEIGGKNLDDWLKETHNTDPAVREAAARTIPSFGPDARKPAIKDMVRLIGDPDPGVRMAALGTVGAMMFEGKDDQQKVFEGLRRLLGDSYQGGPARLYATRALAVYGTDAGLPANITVLDQLKNDPWWETRQAVASALGKIGAATYDDPPKKDTLGQPIPKRPASEPAQKTLRHLMETDKSAAVRLEAVYSLIAHGAPPFTNQADYANAIRPNLDAVVARLTGKWADGKKATPETDGAVRVWLYVLQMVYDDRSLKESLPKIAEFLQDSKIAARSQALLALAALGPRAEPVLTQVRECLTNYKDQPVLAAAAVGVLSAMGPKVAEGAIPDLEKLRAETKNDDLKKIAADAIDHLSGKKKEEKK